MSMDKLKTDLTAGKISRRRFMEGAAALGIAVTAAEGVMTKALAQAPQKGGTYKQGLTGGASSDVMDPAKILDSYMINVSSQLRNNLTEIGPDGQLRAELATEWEASADAATWTFTLRDGVEFHNGKSLTADDVVESFRHHMGPDSGSAASGLTGQITEVMNDGGKVVFKLVGGNADWPFIVSDYHLPICPAKDGGGIDHESGTGTGGYKVVRFEPGVNTVVERFANYWKSDAAYFDSIENLFVADVAARTSAVMTGELHSMSNLDLKTVHLLQRNADVKVFPTYGNKHATLPMDCRTAPYSDVNVRLALKHAINRAEIVEKVLKGFGEPGNDHPVGPANIYRATPEELEQRAYDPEKAKFYLQQAGLTELKVDLHLANTAFEGAIDAGTLFSESARAAGIDITVVREPDDGYWSDTWLVKPFCGSYWGGRATEDWVFSQLFSKDAEWNESHWANEDFEKLLVAARSELDTAKRREMYVEMQRIVNMDSGVIIPIFMAYTHAARANVGMPEQIANNWELDGHKNGERWWFTS